VRQTTSISAPTVSPAGTSAPADGIVMGDAPIAVDAYIDFLCPFCRQFEENSGDALRQMVDEGLIRLIHHPLGFLDELSTTRYSSRAAAASGCAADGGRYMPYAIALFANQPPEGGPGLSDEELAALGLGIGLDERFTECIAAGRYLEWAAYVTARAMERGVSGTPSVFVQDVPVPANASTIAAAVGAIATRRV
jgi:protein-disulfide isomerase